MKPFMLKKERIEVPCGKCPACINRRASGWSFRLMVEERHSDSAFFLTLTYATKHLKFTHNGYRSLDKRDVQLFMKRLRKRHEKRKGYKPIKYFLVGEYGGQFKRPHYHAILFNAHIDDIQPAWEMGSVHYGFVNYASVGYCMKYISKPSMIGRHKRDDRVKEFALISKGIGEKYLTKAMCKWHRASNDRMYVNLDQGKKAAMPRYYKQKIWSDGERRLIGELTRKAMEERDSRRKGVKVAVALERYKAAVRRSQRKLLEHAK